MGKRIFRGALLMAVAAVVLMGILASFAGYQMAEEQLENALWQEMDALASLKAQNEHEAAYLALLKGMTLGDRLTWIAEDGAVLYDSQSSAEGMENHLDREEIARAATEGEGMAKRYSQTLLDEHIYCARRLEDGSFLRLSTTQRSIGGYLTRMLWVMAAGALLIGLMAAALSKGWTARLVKPINQIDMEKPLNNAVYDELTPMLRRMEEQRCRLDRQWQELSRRQGELDAILSHMNEGLVFLDKQGQVLMMNQSARDILHVTKAVDGVSTLPMYNRAGALLRAVSAAKELGSAHADMQASGRDYLITASAVKGEEGMVVLMQDVTEQNAAERSRQRFSANVSHELRTPLTTISGYVELMQNGMMQPSDIPVFARKIYDESRRLLKLIEDIMHLSRLEEGFGEGQKERVELLSTAKDAMESVMQLAEEKDVKLSVDGDEAAVMGDPTLIGEMLRNLIENGIKYNRTLGWVKVQVENEGETARVTVRDNGIGIPPEHQGRVFERFYRVDKSRSKQTGGTGLGLSIVKHGAEYHAARLSLSSETDVGTVVTLVFPAASEAEA